MSSGINLVKEYIAEHPDWQKCTPALSSFLGDAFVTDDVLKHALTESVKLGIPHNIYGCKSLDPNIVKALATQLEETRGVSFKLACRAIVTWGLILDKCSTSQTDYLLQQSTVITNSSAICSIPPLSLFDKVYRAVGGLVLCVINFMATVVFGYKYVYIYFNTYTYEGLFVGLLVYALAIFPHNIFLWIFKTNQASPPPPFFQVTLRAFSAMLITIVCAPLYVRLYDIESLSVDETAVLTMICFYVCQIYVLRWLSPKAARSGEGNTNNHIDKH